MKFSLDLQQSNRSRPRSAAEIDVMVDQTVSMLENVQVNLQKPKTTSALVHHPEVLIKREPIEREQAADNDMKKDHDEETEGSMESEDPNKAFIEDDHEDDTPGNFT